MLFGRSLGCHVIQFPSKRFGYVGSLPTVLAKQIPATESAVMGGRAFRDESGALVEWKFPSFDTEAEARAFAAEHSVTLSN